MDGDRRSPVEVLVSVVLVSTTGQIWRTTVVVVRQFVGQQEMRTFARQNGLVARIEQTLRHIVQPKKETVQKSLEMEERRRRSH
jgi:hypothetical protein